MDTWSSGKKQSQTNPIYPVVASGEAGTKPKPKMPKQTQPVVSLSNLFKPNLSRRSLWRSRKQNQFVVSLSNLFPNFPKKYFLIAISGKNKYAHENDAQRYETV
ncbi:MAG: hypothetical protein ACYSU3_11705 [Planctomycetota bacterium]|jgi:hypothetical protein